MEREDEIAEAHKNTPPIHRAALAPPGTAPLEAAGAEQVSAAPVAASQTIIDGSVPAPALSLEPAADKQANGKSQPKPTAVHAAAGTAFHGASHRAAQSAAADGVVRAAGVSGAVSVRESALRGAGPSAGGAVAGGGDHDRHRGGVAVPHAVQVHLRTGCGGVHAVSAPSILAIHRARPVPFRASHRLAAVVFQHQ